jgi:cell division inhibitor SulA/protein ImuA
LPTGFGALDRCLPGGGWPRQGLIELLADRHGIGELSLLMPALAALCGEEHGGWLAWVSPPYQPYAPALAACGIDVDRVLVVRPGPVAWVMEQSLRSGSCSAVLVWLDAIELPGLRRLQLAAEQAGCLAVAFRRLRARHEPSPAVLRIALEPGPAGLLLSIEKSRGGRPVQLQLGSPGGPLPVDTH